MIYKYAMLGPKAISQITKTVLSPVTHARNFLSAGAFAAAFVGAGFGSSVASLEQDIAKTNIEPTKNTKTHL